MERFSQTAQWIVGAKKAVASRAMAESPREDQELLRQLAAKTLSYGRVAITRALQRSVTSNSDCSHSMGIKVQRITSLPRKELLARNSFLLLVTRKGVPSLLPRALRPELRK